MVRAQEFAVTGGLALLAWASASAQTSFTVQPESRVVLLGRSNVHSWSCATSNLAAMVAVDSAKHNGSTNGSGTTVSTLSITVPVKSLDCGRARMNEDMYRALRADEFPEIRYVLRTYQVEQALGASDSISVRSVGDLTVAGKTQRVEIHIRGRREGGALVRGEGGVKLRMTDFGIKPPTAFLRAIRTKNSLEVRIEGRVSEKNVSAAVTSRDTAPGATAVFGAAAERQPVDTGLRIIISVTERRMRVVGETNDTLRSAAVAVGSEGTVRRGDKVWTFSTPRGVTVVATREANPVWIPPEWHYVEIANKQGLALEQLHADRAVRLSDGSQLVVRGAIIGVVGVDSVFRELPADEEIVFGATLFIPPFGTRNRRAEGVLGAYRLVLGNGVGLHGTPDKSSIGKPATHGCIRLSDDDILWLYENVPLGTRVIIY
jgi:lipoprotein-anchoring transpeptidase ErfK/SrfK